MFQFHTIPHPPTSFGSFPPPPPAVSSSRRACHAARDTKTSSPKPNNENALRSGTAAVLCTWCCTVEQKPWTKEKSCVPGVCTTGPIRQHLWQRAFGQIVINAHGATEGGAWRRHIVCVPAADTSGGTEGNRNRNKLEIWGRHASGHLCEGKTTSADTLKQLPFYCRYHI